MGLRQIVATTRETAEARPSLTMLTKIQLNPSSVEKEVAVHVLPCHIAYDGPSKVSHHFKPRVDPANQTISVCCFRGRKLCGRTISLPPNYFGTPFGVRFLCRSRFPSCKFNVAIRSSEVWRQR